jgi:ketosteroid isomerase-like protein
MPSSTTETDRDADAAGKSSASTARISNDAEQQLRELFADLDAGRAGAVLNRLSDDVVCRFGNQEQVIGRAGFARLLVALRQAIAGLRHEIHAVWLVGESPVAIAEMTVHYERLDGDTVSLPCCNVFRFSADLISEYRVYVDIAPALAS